MTISLFTHSDNVIIIITDTVYSYI